MIGLLSEKIEPFVKRQCAPPLPTGERVEVRGLGLRDIEPAPPPCAPPRPSGEWGAAGGGALPHLAPPHPALRADLSPVGRGESYCVAAHSDALAD